jgi:hypothetical protein
VETAFGKTDGIENVNSLDSRMVLIAGLLSLVAWPALANEVRDIRSVQPELKAPKAVVSVPGPGKRVKQTAPEYVGTKVYHALYLPSDWMSGVRYPVIVEYAGNGRYRNKFGDRCTGKVEDCNLGYGISGGRGFIWLCLPYISEDHKQNQIRWWGDIEATVDYCKRAVARVCAEYGGDPANVFLAGFSRGSIACNFIGLHDDEIAKLWRGFICHSHYDGVKEWTEYAGSDRLSAVDRLKRLKGRPQFISHEGSIEGTQSYLRQTCPDGDFTFVALPYRNHTDAWVLRDIPARRAVREWLQRQIGREKLTPNTP